jgi:hypothetical protein
VNPASVVVGFCPEGSAPEVVVGVDAVGCAVAVGLAVCVPLGCAVGVELVADFGFFVAPPVAALLADEAALLTIEWLMISGAPKPPETVPAVAELSPVAAPPA